MPLSAPIAALLKEHLVRRAALKKKAGRSWLEMNYVFTTAQGTPISPRNVNRSLKAILKRAGIPHLRVHDLRHSAATFAIADGVPAPYVQKMLGHSNVQTTLSVYTKIVPGVLQQATGTLDRVTKPTQKPAMATEQPARNSVVTDKVTDTKKKRTKKMAVIR